MVWGALFWEIVENTWEARSWSVDPWVFLPRGVFDAGCAFVGSAADPPVSRRSYVVEQLRCLGVLRTCEVLKVGMPTRISYSDLKQVGRPVWARRCPCDAPRPTGQRECSDWAPIDRLGFGRRRACVSPKRPAPGRGVDALLTDAA